MAPAAQRLLDEGADVEAREVTSDRDRGPGGDDVLLMESHDVVPRDARDRLPRTAGGAGAALLVGVEGGDPLERGAVAGDGPFLVDLGQPRAYLPGHLVVREGGLGDDLPQQVEGRLEVPLHDVEVEGEAGLAHGRAVADALALEQAGQLLGGVLRRPLVHGPRHDGGHALESPRLGADRDGQAETHGDDVLAGHVVGDEPDAVGQVVGDRLGEGPLPRRGDLGARDARHAATSASSSAR